MKNRIKKKLLKYPDRYKLHQYLKYAHQWASEIAYKGRLYYIFMDGAVKIEKEETK